MSANPTGTPGERFGYATWIARAPTRPSVGQITTAELNPKRLVETLAWEAVGVESWAVHPAAPARRVGKEPKIAPTAPLRSRP